MILIKTIDIIKKKYPNAVAVDYDVRNFGKRVYYVYMDDDAVHKETDISLNMFEMGEE